MADRRMFSAAVTQSYHFFSLSPRARLLYYDLGMAADNDGVVQAYCTLQASHASREDLEELVRENYLLPLDEKNLLYYIVDWNTNNRLRHGRFRHGNYYEMLCDVLGIEQESDQPDANPPEPAGNPPAIGSEPTAIDSEPTAIDSEPADIDSTPADNGGECQHITEGNRREGKGTKQKGREGNQLAASAAGSPRPARADPPSVDEIAAYCRERGSHIDPRRFHDYYTARDWRTGAGRIRDWKAAVRLWESRDTQKGRNNPAAFRDYSHDEGSL